MRLKAPAGVGAVSFDGQSYSVKDGVVEVPDTATVLLEPGWGFEMAEEEQAGKPTERTAGETPAPQKPKPKTE
jgi:hypothetical protein